MGLFTNPLGHAGYPPGVTGTPETQPASIRAAKEEELADNTLNNIYISPKTLSSSFASPPDLGFGSTTPRPVHATTLDSTGNTSLGTGAASVVNVGVASSTIGFFGATAVEKPASTDDLRTTLINLGLYTTGGASPLNLNGGALTAGALTATGASTIGSGAGVDTAIGNATGKVGFFGSAGFTVVTQGAITNNVASGGTGGTIDNFTDLTVYANDAATIRNDIYQLSLALANVVGALRSYGLLV